MNILEAKNEDINKIEDIYNIARSFMIKNNNPNQWDEYYPNKNIIINDINNHNLFMIYSNNELVGVFTFIIGEDETYKIIKKGKWNSNKKYGTIHRLASNGKCKGIADFCFDYCKSKIDYLRIDTHKDNKIMNEAIIRNGFVKCGIIYVRDNTERTAYDYRREND